jgi:hypothetical protein
MGTDQGRCQSTRSIRVRERFFLRKEECESVTLTHVFHHRCGVMAFAQIFYLFFPERKSASKVDYNMVHLRTYLVQLFELHQNFEKVIQMIELKRFGGAPNGYPFVPLSARASHTYLTTDAV